LGVVEVGRHGNNGLADRVTEVGLGVALQLLQNACRDLLGGVLGAVNVDAPVLTHVALHRTNGAIGVGNSLTLRDFTDQNLSGLGKSDDRRGGAAAFG